MDIPKALSALPGVGIVLNETWISSQTLRDSVRPDMIWIVPIFTSEEEKSRDMNVTQNKMIWLHVENKNFTKQKQKAQTWINLFMTLWLKETLILFLIDFIHSGKGK